MTSSARLYALFFQDRSSRLRMYTASFSVAFTFGLLGLMLGSSTDEAAKGAVVLSLFVMSAWTFFYCFKGAVRATEPAEMLLYPIYEMPPRRAAIWGILLWLSIALGFSTRRVEAAIMDHRLRLALSGDPPYDKANSLIDAALHNDLPANPSTIDAGRRLLEAKLRIMDLAPEVRQSISPTIVRLNGYLLYSRGQRLRVLAPRPILFPAGHYMITGTLNWGSVVAEGEGQETSVIVPAFDASPQTPAVLVMPRTAGGDSVIRELGITRPSEDLSNAPDFLRIEGADNNILVFDVNVSNLAQDLAAAIWIGVSFTNCRIRYKGEPLQITGVTFAACTFEFGDATRARRALDIIRSNGREPTTLIIQ